MRKKKIPASCYECDHVRIDADTKALLCRAVGLTKINLKRGQHRAEFCPYIPEEKRKDCRGIRKAAIMALALMLLTGCEEPLQNMEVVDKIYEPERVILIPQHLGNTTIIVPHIIDEECVIVIQGTDSKGNVRELRRTVTRKEFEEIMIGDKLEEDE